MKVSPKHGVVRFGRIAKLAPRYVGPFEILDRIDSVAYQLALPFQVSRIHDIFHVSMLRKYEPDPFHMIDLSELEVNQDVTFEEQPIQVLDSREQVFRGKVISLVRMLWRHRDFEETMWEREASIRERFLKLFTD